MSEGVSRTKVGHRSRGLRLVSVMALVFGALGLLQSAVLATSLTYTFQLDGDVSHTGFGNFSGSTPSSTYDWDQFLAACTGAPKVGCATNGDVTVSPTLPDAGLPGYLTSSASPDYVLADHTVFTQGSKDTLPVSGWTCTTKNNLGAKDDLVNAYQVAWVDPISGHLLVFFGAEKSSNLGDNNIAIWLLQDSTVGCDSSGGTTNFTGDHINNDLLLAAAFTNGGSNATIDVFKWNNGLQQIGGDNHQLCKDSLTLTLADPTTHLPPTVCAITNTVSVQPTWNHPAKTTNNDGSYKSEEFYEGVLDVTDLLGSTPCFNTTITDTRSSQSDTATIFDYVGQGFHTCGATSMQTIPAKANPATLDGAGSTTLTFYEKNTGSVALDSPTISAYKPDGSALTDCNSSMVKAPNGTEGTGGSHGTLATALTAGTATTTLTLQAGGLSGPVAAGDPLQLGSGASVQTAFVHTAAAAGATTVTIDSFTPTQDYPIATPVTDIVAGGDLNSNAKLDPGETWAFKCTTSSISTTTTVTAVGHGTATGKDVTFCGGRLTSALASGTAYTSLAVTPLTSAVHNGDSVRIDDGTHNQTVTASANASAGATSISVASFNANAAYATGTLVGSTSYPCNYNEITTVTVTVINPSTSMAVTASAEITYTFAETNDSSDAPLDSPSITAGRCDATPVYQSGDSNSNTKLDPGETWIWTCKHTLSGPAGDQGSSSEQATGTGHGSDVAGNDITFCTTAGSNQKCDSSEQDSVLVSITNNAQGAAPSPSAVNDSYTVAAGGTLTKGAAGGVLANDVPSTGVTAAVDTAASCGTLSLNANGGFTFTAPNASGTCTFTYKNTDTVTGSVSSAATVTITVT